MGLPLFCALAPLDHGEGTAYLLKIIMADNHITYHQPSGLDGVELLRLTDPDFGFAPHMHDAYVFWFNGEGGERVSIGRSSDILQPDSFGVVAPGEIHANHAVTEHRTLESLYVSHDALEEAAAQSGSLFSAFRSRLQQDRQSRTVLARLHATLMQDEDPFITRETFLRAMSLLLERHGESSPQSDILSDPAKVRLARIIMNERFTEALELDELAALCGCSACHLIRLFRRETGMTPHAYLVECRLSLSKALLRGAAPISDIAQETGFTDQSHLTRRFAARFGVTPGVYRRQISS